MRFLNLICCILLAIICTTTAILQASQAELTVIKDFEGQQGFTVHRMTVTPAAEPIPALKHRFVVPMHKRKPGNAAMHYLRSFGEFPPNERWRRIKAKYGEQVYDWYDYATSIDTVPMQGFREVAPMFQKLADHFISDASRCRECEWGLHEMDLRGLDTINYRLSEAQESRAISRGLSYISRLAIVDRRFEDAIENIRMNYQLGQDFGKRPFLVCNLIGLAEVGIANLSVIELISTPDAPNLFWALSELPRPIISMRESMNLEMSLGLRIFPALLDVDEREHSSAEWKKLVDSIVNGLPAFFDAMQMRGNRLPDDPTLLQLSFSGLSMVVYPAAKQRLIDAGTTMSEVEAMSVSQVLVTDTAYEFQKLADDYEKWTFLPYEQMPEVEFPRRRLQDGFGPILADLLLPAATAARTAQMRTQWQMDSIRVVEALRMHAAEIGSFPKSLDEVTVVPVPRNPITQQPFEYRLDGATAVLDLPFSDGMPGAAWRFELTLAE